MVVLGREGCTRDEVQDRRLRRDVDEGGLRGLGLGEDMILAMKEDIELRRPFSSQQRKKKVKG